MFLASVGHLAMAAMMTEVRHDAYQPFIPQNETAKYTRKTKMRSLGPMDKNLRRTAIMSPQLFPASPRFRSGVSTPIFHP